MHIAQVQEDQLDSILTLFRETVSHICRYDYELEQISVWLKAADNRDKWLEKLKAHYFLGAWNEAESIVGFASLVNGDYIDMMYVHKDHQRKGIASALLSALEKESYRLNTHTITVDVSYTARPFFEAKGYEIVREQRRTIDGVEIRNFKMRKESRSH